MGTHEIGQILYGFDQLCELVDAEPSLSAFAEVAAELRAVTKNVREFGDVKSKYVTRRSELRIPTRALAIKIMAIVDRIPGPSDGDAEEERLRIATLLANVSFGFMHAIFRDYSDLASSDPDTD